MMLTRNNFDLLWQFTKTSFKMRYQNSILGILWVLIKPYITFLVLFFVFSSFRGDTLENYSMYLLIGIVFYTFFNELLVNGQMALLENAHIILKVNFPRQIVIASALINAMINLLINLVLILAILIIQKVKINLGELIFLPIILCIFILSSLGLSFFLSILTIKFRDLRYIVELGLFLLYWATPIFYVLDTDLLSSTTKELIALNPLGILINQTRASLGIYGEIDIAMLALFLVVSVVLALSGWIYFNFEIKSIAEKF